LQDVFHIVKRETNEPAPHPIEQVLTKHGIRSHGYRDQAEGRAHAISVVEGFSWGENRKITDRGKAEQSI
jgi:hypothetical protein